MNGVNIQMTSKTLISKIVWILKKLYLRIGQTIDAHNFYSKNSRNFPSLQDFSIGVKLLVFLGDERVKTEHLLLSQG